MKSMTGFGRGRKELNGYRILVEVQSVNKKGLEVSFSYPREWQSLESRLQELVQSKISRGKIQGSIQITSLESSVPGDFLDTHVTDRAWDQLRRLADRYNVPFQPDLQTMVQWMQFALNRFAAPALEELADTVLEAVSDALDELVTMREREGAALRQDFVLRLQELRRCHAETNRLAPDGVVRYREHLLKRLQQAQLEINLDDERLLREIALFAERCDITEELTRLESHFQQLDGFLTEKEPIGRKLEFLLQEIHREWNTIGSKSTQVEIARTVIVAKQEVDRLREQSLNVE
jgi:uncharacterized protein (TIGR00255 family)